jgi:type III secretion protein C
VRAAELRWRNNAFTIVANGKKISEFIRELASSQGVTAVVDAKVDGVVSGRFSGTPQQTLDTICSTYGLTWYFDGTFLYVEPADQSQTQLISIPPNSAGEIGRALQALQIPDKRFTLVINDRSNSVYVSGPRRYVDLVRQTVTTASEPSVNDQRADMRAFPLKYAWASDLTINRSGKEVLVPGVATLLRKLFGKDDEESARLARTTASGQAVRQVKLSSGLTVGVPRLDVPAMPTGLPQEDKALPHIVADPAINTVLVRDLPENMYRYERLIGQIDLRPRIVEINVTIIDINENSLDSLGIDWRLHTTHGDVQIGNGNAPLAGNTQFGTAGNPALTFAAGTSEAGQTFGLMPTGIALTASIGGSLRNYLLTRINALAQTGQAEMRSKPKVLALDNTEAILENLTQFYVPVSGFQDASLYGVTTGTSIKVTPMIINDTAQGATAPPTGNPESVMMSIDIQDGNVVTGAAVSGVPVIQQRNIVTKTMIEEGRSLLIAGFNNDEVKLNKSGVPWLQDIPLIGNLFKYTDKNGNHMERFYLLTPRVVKTSSMYAPDGSPVNPSLNMPVDASGMSMYRPPNSDIKVPLAPNSQPGTKFGSPVLPPQGKEATLSPVAAGAPKRVNSAY